MRKDDVTQELPGVARRPGRPRTGKAMSSAERKAAERARLHSEGKGTLSCPVALDVLEALRKHVQFKEETQGDVVERILRGYLLRKR